jgi:histidinol-phosphate phosphatase family protein
VVSPAAPEAVLLDRDGTLLVDVPYNGEPAAVEPLPGVPAALQRLRAAGCRLAVVSNQSGIGRGWITCAQVAAVNRRMSELLGPFDAVLVCPHIEAAGCECRKPRPGLLRAALGRLGVPAARAAMIGDIGADVEAAAAAGMRGVLVPTVVTRPAEIEAASEVADDLAGAVDLLVDRRAERSPR